MVVKATGGSSYYQIDMNACFYTLALLVALSGCRQFDFEPFDYDTYRNAHMSLRPFGYSVELEGRELSLQKKFPLGEKEKIRRECP